MTRVPVNTRTLSRARAVGLDALLRMDKNDGGPPSSVTTGFTAWDETPRTSPPLLCQEFCELPAAQLPSVAQRMP
jgi:hypothetical protein